MNINPVAGAPHAHDGDSVSRLMGLVLLALLPAVLYGVVLFGWPAVNLLIVTLIVCLLCEAGCLWLAGRSVRLGLMDGTALLTGVLLALSLPPWAPWWIGAVGGGFAIIVGKQVFGGTGQNVFNPAMLARVMLLVSFPVEMTTWLEPHPWLSGSAPGFLEGLLITFGHSEIADGVTGATILGYARTELVMNHALSQILPEHYHTGFAAIGWTGGSLGETSAILVLMGGLWLLWRKAITWYIPVAMLGAVLVLASGFHWLNAERFADPVLHVLSGGLMLGAFFIATDPVTSPVSRGGQIVFGIGCGALVYIIRTWGGYPEGVAFAVVLMNAATPLVDHYLRPRAYGRTWSGQSRPISERAKHAAMGRDAGSGSR
ncbi:MAG: RnfABCDGE type electron transport complex subunit D [Candidatus Competibacteraceae bacterium]|nr:RnfABCDGE type electron transport complex subunit D [Candidatus Competibacteraceae bacterium]MCB1770158.1 RnfABCDGE type electron transport complex subunit D [Candidatus Competibacteraceae bacterium]HRX71543.1 RnfABCDGE type electron transport complex subunit D [Candidatus Competibacteraceae bacterium]